MKEYDILKYLILDLNDATPAEVAVRTEGGDQPASPPEIVLTWNAQRLPNYAGHTSYAGPILDSDGNATGKEWHQYFIMDIDALVRHDDEFERDKLLDTVHEMIAPYESNPGAFNDDTAQWSCGIAGPRDNSFVEPDWYELGVPISFVYMKRAKETDAAKLPGTLDTIDITVNSRDYVIADGETVSVPPDATRYYRTITVNGDYTIDGTVYANTYTVNSTGTLTVNGDLIVSEDAYSEIEDTTAETITE